MTESHSSPDKKYRGIAFEGDTTAEQQLWQALGELPKVTSTPRLRRRFYRRLDQLNQPTLLEVVSRRLGLQGNAGFVTAVASLVLGLAVGMFINGAGMFINDNGAVERAEFSELRQQVAILNRNLVLDRLQDASANTRLLGVLDAAELAQQDPQIANALLIRAIEDPVVSVRSAAVEALGPQLKTPAVGDELMMLFDTADSPMLQLALTELVLRHGNGPQLEYLIQISREGALPAELAEYVQSSIRSENDNASI